MQETAPAVPAIEDFPALSGLDPEQRCQFALTEFIDHPGLHDYLVGQGTLPEQVPELVAMARPWKNATPEERREMASPILRRAAIIINAGAGLTESTKAYLRTLRPGQPVDLARVRRSAQNVKPRVIVLHAARQPSARRSPGAARAICGGSGDDDGGGDGPPDPPSVALQPPLWHRSKTHLVLNPGRPNKYAIPICQLVTSSDAADWLDHVARKTWASCNVVDKLRSFIVGLGVRL